MKFKIFPGTSILKPGLSTKFGIDPTLDRLHLGHLVPLRLVRKFQEQGNPVTIVLGTFTATLGDPSGRDSTRPFLDKEVVKSNAQKILLQLNKFLLPFKVFENGSLFETLMVRDFINNIVGLTVNDVLNRDSFRRRIAEGNSIALHELLVPIFQGLDSVWLQSELEIGGQDQLFNFNLTRNLQISRGFKPQICLMTPIIRGTDGRKMSKSFNNCIFVDESPEDIFGKVMSISDNVMLEWFPLLSDNIPLEKPMESKKLLAFDIVSQIHGKDLANKAKEIFQSVIQNKQIPDNIQIIHTETLLETITTFLNCSKSRARRLINQGSIRINDKKVDNDMNVNFGDIIKMGKHHWVKIG